MNNWTELKRLAEEATIARPGNWYTHDDCCWWTGDADEGDFMAASNPKTILALIAENERLRKRLEVSDDHPYDGIYCRDATIQGLEQLIEKHWRPIEKERDKLSSEVEELRMLLIDAAGEIGEWGAYVSEYFQEKHDLAGCVAKFKDAARKLNP